MLKHEPEPEPPEPEPEPEPLTILEKISYIYEQVQETWAQISIRATARHVNKKLWFVKMKLNIVFQIKNMFEYSTNSFSVC